MKLLFTKTINDATKPGRAFFAGSVYEFGEERAKQIMSAVPDAVQEIRGYRADFAQTEEEPKRKSRKSKKVQDEVTVKEELDFIETPVEV